MIDRIYGFTCIWDCVTRSTAIFPTDAPRCVHRHRIPTLLPIFTSAGGMIDSGEALAITRQVILMCASSRVESGSPGVMSLAGGTPLRAGSFSYSR